MKYKLLLITILAAMTLTACNSEPEWIEYESETEAQEAEETETEEIFPYRFNKIVLIATHVVSDIEFIAKGISMLKKGVIVDSAPLLRVLAETKPTEEATIVSPTLEDYYLYVFWDAAGVR